MEPGQPGPLGLPPGVRACLFDLDGVLTKTAAVHDAAWTETFDSFLRDRADRTGEQFRPFDPEDDYNTYVDGKPRADGVRDFLASRGIELDEGSADDAPDAETVNGLGNRKNVVLQRRIHDDGVELYDGSVRYVRAVRDAGLAAAVVSSSANTRDVLDVTGIADLFDGVVDGNVLRERGLRGKPAPDGFLEGARLLDAKPAEAAVFEDAVSGVEAGRAGGFAIVIGVDRVGHAQALHEHGADRVVADLEELLA
jgi:beta-phosphoglucomutase family hydrolase